MKINYLINKLTSKKLPFTRALLSIKMAIPSSFYLCLVIIVSKFLGLLIITSNFIYQNFNNNDEIKSFGLKLTNIFQVFTVFGLFGQSLSYPIYSSLCYLIFIIEIIFILSFLKFYLNIKKKENYLANPKSRTLWVLILSLFVLFAITAQHIIELNSFSFVIQFNTLTTTDYELFNSVLNNKSNYFANIILILINFFSIIFINVVTYYTFHLFNEPFFHSDFPVNLKYSNLSIFLMILLINLHSVHYVENILRDVTNIDISTSILLLKLTLFIFLFFIFLLIFFKRFKHYNYTNFYSIGINFLLNYSFFSMIIEVILSSTNNYISDLQQLIFIFLCKIILSGSLIFINNFIFEKIYIKSCKVFLFKIYDGKLTKGDLNHFYYLLEILINNKTRLLGNEINKILIEEGLTIGDDLESQSLKDLNSLLNIILSHKMECNLEYCKCNIVNNFKNSNVFNKEINFILETIFTQINLYKEKDVNMLFSEYLFLIKESTLFSYSILNTFINKNLIFLSNINLMQLYSLTFKKIKNYNDSLIKNVEIYADFSQVFEDFELSNFYTKKMQKFSDNFENFISFKEKFDSSLKVDQNTNKIDSYIFSSIDELVLNCKKNKNLYQKIKNNIKNDFADKKCKSLELFYKLNMFLKFLTKRYQGVFNC